MRWIFVFILCLPLTLKAQKEYTITGSIGVESGETFSYQLIFTDSSGYLKGHSLTWLKKERDIRTAIEGKIDRERKTISFKETEIVYNHGFESNATICLIRAILKYTPDRAINALFGPMSSSDLSNSYCGRGTVNFDNSETIKELFSPVIQTQPQVQQPKPKSKIVVYETVPSKPGEEIKPRQDKVTSGMEKIYEWHSDSVIIDIWDGGHIDGDIVSLRFNEQEVLQRYAITQEKKRLIFPLTPGINTIFIKAENEGNEPPNTADILLTDKDITHSILAYNRIGKTAIIKIRRIK